MATNPPQKPVLLEPAYLGNKEYWDNAYALEIQNHALNPSDEGQIWFDDSAAEDKVICFLETQILRKKILGDGVTRANCNFLDLGTGNGHFLFALREGVHGEESDDEDGYEDREDGGDGGDVGEREDRGMGWGGRMLGVDYSEKSVEFARRIAQEKGYGEGGGKAREVEFIWWDIMTRSPAGLLTGRSINGFDVVLDKGTFDAISLSKETDSNGRRICEGYKERVVPLIREGGIFVITSCNWTEEEVRAWFEGQELEFVDRVAYKTFDFGGKKGSTISSICFRRRRVEAPVAQ